MGLFSKRRKLDVDLGEATLQEILYDIPELTMGSAEELYLRGVHHSNHLVLDVNKSKSFSSGFFDVQYKPQERELEIFGRFDKAAFLLYLSFGVPAVFLGLAFFSQQQYFYMILAPSIALLISTLMLTITIRAGTKEIEREVIIRINAHRRR